MEHIERSQSATLCYEKRRCGAGLFRTWRGRWPIAKSPYLAQLFLELPLFTLYCRQYVHESSGSIKHSGRLKHKILEARDHVLEVNVVIDANVISSDGTWTKPPE